MTCSLCGGYVEWKGTLANLTHTECHGCGAINCQEVEDDSNDDDEEMDDEPDFTLDDLEWAETYPAQDREDARDAADEAKAEDMRERMAERDQGDDYDYAADDLAYDAARERGAR